MIDFDTLDLSDLRDDGDSIEVSDGVTITLRIERDDLDIFDLWDDDNYGAIAWVETQRWSGQDAERPSGFDGAAYKLAPIGYVIDGRVWWQPPAWAIENGPETVESLRSSVMDLLTYGFQMIGLVVTEERESSIFPGLFSEVETASAWLGGIEPGIFDRVTGDPAYVAELVNGLAWELAQWSEVAA